MQLYKAGEGKKGHRRIFEIQTVLTTDGPT